MKSTNSLKYSRQRGQATMLSFSIFLIFGLWACYLILRSEASQSTSLRAMEQRHALLTHSRKTADILNQISFNNKNILVSLAIMTNAFSEAYNLAKLRYATMPPWEGRSFNPMNPRATQDILSGLVFNESVFYEKTGNLVLKFVENNPLATIEIDELAAEAFTKFSKRGARALRVAAGLTARNQELKIQLIRSMNKINDDVFTQSSFSQSLCLSTRLGLLESGVSYDGDRCALDASSWSGALLDLKALADKWMKEKQPPIGVLYVKSEKSKEFLKGMQHTSTDGPQTDNRLKTFVQLIATPDMNLDTPPETRSPQLVTSAVGNNQLRLKAGCKAKHDIDELLSPWQWDEAIKCGVDANGLAKAFFNPGWVPFILEFKNRS